MVGTWERTDLKSNGGKKGPGTAEAKSLLRCVLQLKTFKQCSSWRVFVDMEPGCNAFGAFKTLQLTQSDVERPCSIAVGGTQATARDQQHPFMGVCKMVSEFAGCQNLHDILQEMRFLKVKKRG